jgi:hypothetical protein
MDGLCICPHAYFHPWGKPGAATKNETDMPIEFRVGVITNVNHAGSDDEITLRNDDIVTAT